MIAKTNRPVVCLDRTKDGHPKHPLYLPKSVKPIPFGPSQPYPSSGITGPGQWGSADGVTWTRVPDGELLKVDGTKSPFIMGYLIASADEAFRAMRDGIEATR